MGILMLGLWKWLSCPFLGGKAAISVTSQLGGSSIRSDLVRARHLWIDSAGSRAASLTDLRDFAVAAVAGSIVRRKLGV